MSYIEGSDVKFSFKFLVLIKNYFVFLCLIWESLDESKIDKLSHKKSHVYHRPYPPRLKIVVIWGRRLLSLTPSDFSSKINLFFYKVLC